MKFMRREIVRALREIMKALRKIVRWKLLTSTMTESAFISSSRIIVSSSFPSWTMILIRGIITLFTMSGKHCKRARNWFWVVSHSLFLTLQHNCKLLISNWITLSPNCRAEMSKFSRESSKHNAYQFFVVNWHPYSKKLVTSNFDLLQKGIHRFIALLDPLKFKLKIQDISSWSGSKSLLQRIPYFP